MPIVFHCPQCSKQIKAPDGSGGNHAPCPYCGQKVYIPIPMDELETIDLAPLDEEAMRLEQELIQETRATAANLRHAKGENPENAEDALAGSIHRWVKHMTNGELDQADNLRERILRQRDKATKLVQQIANDEIPPASLADIPRPVLNGLLKQLLSDSEAD